MICLTNLQDEIFWGWTNNGFFSVKSTYEHLTRSDTGDSYKMIWKAQIPYKIKIFLWLLAKGATLTKDNMRKRKWTGDPTCRFCDAVETTNHLFFQCPTAKVVWGIVATCMGANTVPSNLNQYWNWIKLSIPDGNQFYTFGLAAISWAIWKARNKACFEFKLIKHPAEILCHACALMNFWTGLYKVDLQEQIVEGVKTMLSVACRILANQPRPPPTQLRLLPVPEEEDDQGGDDEPEQA